MASAEEDFPRGGTAKSTPSSKTEKPHVEVDNLFETREPEVKKKKRKFAKQDDSAEKVKKQKRNDKETLKLNTADKVDILHLKNLKVGMLMLGCVKEVSDLEVVVGLPSGLKGFLPITNICDSYTKMLSEQVNSGDSMEEFFALPHLLSPGMLVRCVVSSLDETRGGLVSLKVSINPKDVNKGLSMGSLKAGMSLSCCVESVEDHGFVVDIGVSGTKAFLPKQTAVDESKASKQDLKAGQYMTCVLEEVKNDGRLVRVAHGPPVAAATGLTLADAEQGWTLGNLLPGLLVKASVKKVTAHGLILEFLSSFTGAVDFLHMDPDKASTYSRGDEVTARVLHVDPATRLVGLSLRAHLLPPGGSVLDCVGSARVGEVVEGCKMTAIHNHAGATLVLSDRTPAFIYKSQMKEPKEEFNPNRLLAQPDHTCRVVEYSPMEQILMVSMRKSTLTAPFFSYHDLKLGQVVEGTVIGLQKFGMFVKLTEHIKGVVSLSHLSDVVLKNPEKKFSPGNKVKCRVLSLDAQNRRLFLTNKRALVDSPLPLFLSYEDARVGRVSHGNIACVRDFGCVVRFYGDVKGLVPVHELSTEPDVVPGNLFSEGQVIKVKVLKCDPQNSKLLLSVKAVAWGDTEATDGTTFDFEIGKVVEARVSKKVPSGLEVSILPEEVPALLPTVHLSDHVSNCPLLWEALQEGDTVSNLVCLSKFQKSITLTKKPSLRAALESGLAVQDFSDLQAGQQMIGWVKNIMPYGVFVNFPKGLFGLAPRAALSDKFLVRIEDALQLGQTVVAKVTNLDEEKRRFLVSLKVSEVSEDEAEAAERLIQGQQERKAVQEMMSCRGDSDLQQQLSSVSVGDKLKMTVGEQGEDGFVRLISDQLSKATVLADKHHVTDVNVTPGLKVTAVVLHVDPMTSQVHVSLLPRLASKKKTLEKGSSHEATVEFVDKDFAVASLAGTGHLTVISTTTHLNETFRFETEKLSLGRTLTVTVTDPSCEGLGGLALVSWEASALKRARSAPERKGRTHSYKVGDFVTAKVKSIKPLQVLVALPDGVTGSIHVSEIKETVTPGSFVTSSLKVGSEVKARVIGGREVRSRRFLPFSHPDFVFSLPELTVLPSKLKEDADVRSLAAEPTLKSYTPGQEVNCYVSKFLPESRCLEVLLSRSLTGTVELLAMISIAKQAKRAGKLYKPGQALMAKVVDVSRKKPHRLFLSLKGTHKMEPGSVTMGTVRKVIPHVGLAVRLPFGCKGMATMTDLADRYTENPLGKFSEGQCVRCYAIKEEEGKFHLSLRLSRIHAEKGLKVEDAEVLSLADLKQGQLVRGYVKLASEQGVFIRLSRDVTGRAEPGKATKYFVKEGSMYGKHICQDALVTAKVLSVSEEKNRVDLSLLTEDTGKPDLLPESLGLPLRWKTDGKEKHTEEGKTRKRKLSESQQATENDKKKNKKEKKTRAEGDDSGVEVYFREEDEDDTPKPKKWTKSKKVATLQLSAGFTWDSALTSLQPATSADTHDSSDGEEEEEQSKAPKPSRKQQALERQQEERRLSRLEAELMDAAARPESEAAFERLLLSTPDSSLLWLQYMAFHLQATQIQQARAVAERALKTISFREEQEKQNVWVALLNLENMYGSQESLQKVFERATQFCEPLPIYQKLANIYAKSDKSEEAESLYKVMVKRFRQEKAVWQDYSTFLLRQGKSDAANAILQRALKSLPPKEHLQLIASFGRLEFTYGDKEKAKSMFEKVLSSYPKRTDMWSIFIDLMIKHGTQREVRDLFDRAIHLSAAVKKIKFFFKRYLEYEKKSGTPQSIQEVKQKAMEYVESVASETAS